jgi:AraC-like DNA-binding protein
MTLNKRRNIFLLALSANVVFFIAGILQAILLAALTYFHPKSDRSVNVYLSLYILCVSTLMLIPVVQQLFSWQAMLYLMPFPLLIGPFLYLYVRSFKETITWRKAWPHFLLFFVFLILDYTFLPSLAKQYPSSHQMPKEIILDPASDIRITIRIIRNVQMIIYYFLAQRALISYQKSIHHLFSEVSRINLAWMRWVINGYLFLIVSLLVLFYFVVQFPAQFELVIVVNMAIITPYIYLITFKGLTQPTLWQIKANGQKKNIEHEIIQAEEIELLKKDEKKIESLKRPQDNKTEEIISRIHKIMKGEKLYQETQLSLQELADKIQFPSNQVSQAINEGMKQNFYDLVNSYRVEEAKRLLLDDKNKNFTVFSVGFEAGFNSTSTFNTVFKKFTGLTPAEFKQQKSV